MFWRKKRVFVSFDVNNDGALRDFAISQSRIPGSRFRVVDPSVKQAEPSKTWERETLRAIRSSKLVIVMVGPDAHRAPQVLKEVRMARELGVPTIQITKHRGSKHKPVPGAGRPYRWSSENLKKLKLRK